MLQMAGAKCKAKLLEKPSFCYSSCLTAFKHEVDFRDCAAELTIPERKNLSVFLFSGQAVNSSKNDDTLCEKIFSMPCFVNLLGLQNSTEVA